MNVVPASHKWEFQARFRRHAFGWRSRPAILRIKQAVSEIKKTARGDPVRAAARELAAQQPDFAIGAGLLALRWLAKGFGYEVTGSDVWTAYSSTIAAAERKGKVPEVRAGIRQIISAEGSGGFVRSVLAREFGL